MKTLSGASLEGRRLQGLAVRDYLGVPEKDLESRLIRALRAPMHLSKEDEAAIERIRENLADSTYRSKLAEFSDTLF